MVSVSYGFGKCISEPIAMLPFSTNVPSYGSSVELCLSNDFVEATIHTDTKVSSNKLPRVFINKMLDIDRSHV